jgi:hypothetical protein
LAGWPFGHKAAPDADFDSSLDWKQPMLIGKISFLLVSKVYEWFGMEHARIPYKIDDESGFMLDPEKIKST